MTANYLQDGSALLDIGKIREALFSDPLIAKKIARDYGLKPDQPLEKQIRKTLGQDVVKRGDLSDKAAFKAATFAIASTMRQWAVVFQALPQIGDILKGYDPEELAGAAQDPAQRAAMVDSVGRLLGGQRARDQADWIIRFGERLAAAPNFQASLLEAKKSLKRRAKKLSEAQLNAAVAVLLARGAGRRSPVHDIGLDKVTGMGPPIASEFLRNLGWASFKPDRHIIRLLSAWLSVQERLKITSDIGWNPIFPKRAYDIQQFLDFAVLGERLTPADVTLNQADQLVWMLGVYVHKKPKVKSL